MLQSAPRRVRQPSETPFLRDSSLRLSARGATGASLRRLSAPRFSLPKIAFYGGTCIISQGQEFPGVEIRRGTSVEAPEGASGGRTAVSNNFNTLTADLRIRRNARDPSLPDPSTRSSRISKILGENSIFRHNMLNSPRAGNYPAM